jgi:hypothetical protein
MGLFIMNNDGWIKLNRSILDWGWYQCINVKSLFIHFLLKANYEDKSWKDQIIPKGSFVTSVSRLAVETGLSPMQVRVAIDNLKVTNEITIKTTNKCSIITVCNYDIYQCSEKINNKQNNKQANKQITTTKKDISISTYIKEEKTLPLWRTNFNIYKGECAKEFKRLSTDPEFLSKLRYYYPNINIEKSMSKAYDTYWSTEVGWEKKKKSKTKKINWAATLIDTIKFNQIDL